MKTHFLPFYDERPKGAKIDTLVLHCSAHSAEGVIDALCQHRLSAHYVVGLDGEVIQLIDEEKRAWHAGVSFWRGAENLNHTSVGIEVSSLSMGQEPYSGKQIASLLCLCRDIIARYGIPACNVVAHSDIAPTRKPDPGMAFPWKYLAENGVGLWYNLADAANVEENDVCSLLAQVGYHIQEPAAAAYAFCRHFMPEAVAVEKDIRKLIEYPYAKDFVLDEKGLAVLKACAFSFRR